MFSHPLFTMTCTVCRCLGLILIFFVMDRDKREVAKAKAQDGKQVLDQWKACYFEVRARIETSGRDPRWEFDRKKLFEKTDYMTSICQDLYNILQVSSTCLSDKHLNILSI